MRFHENIEQATAWKQLPTAMKTQMNSEMCGMLAERYVILSQNHKYDLSFVSSLFKQRKYTLFSFSQSISSTF